MNETETAEFETAARRQVCECTHFGDDHNPESEDARCKVIGCDCAEFREQPGPTRTMGITMSVETAIGLEIEAALAGPSPVPRVWEKGDPEPASQANGVCASCGRRVLLNGAEPGVSKPIPHYDGWADGRPYDCPGSSWPARGVQDGSNSPGEN